MNGAIVLCSGGIDSVTTAYYVRSRGYKKIKILFFNYSQKSVKDERRCSKQCAKSLGAEFREIELSWLGSISTSLINRKGSTGKISRKKLKDTKSESEKFYVPCRNTIFLSYAVSLAEALFTKERKKYDIFVGFKNEGKEPFPDATKEFVREMNKLIRVSCNAKVEIAAPLIEMDKEDIILLGKRLGIDYKDTWSCYVGKRIQCGKCLACVLRKEGFYWANTEDPSEYN